MTTNRPLNNKTKVEIKVIPVIEISESSEDSYDTVESHQTCPLKENVAFLGLSDSEDSQISSEVTCKDALSRLSGIPSTSVQSGLSSESPCIAVPSGSSKIETVPSNSTPIPSLLSGNVSTTCSAIPTCSSGTSSASESLAVDLCIDMFNELVAELSKSFKFPRDQKLKEKIQRCFFQMDLEYRKSPQCYSMLKKYLTQVENRRREIYTFVQEMLDDFELSGRPPSSSSSKQIERLEKYLEKLHKKIKEIEEMEVDLDDDSNSQYLLECRYKEKIVKVFHTLCDLKGCERREKLRLKISPTRYPEINLNISKKVNKTQEFPDFPAILEVVQNTTKEVAGLNFTPDYVYHLAKEAFIAVGEELKRRRQRDLAINVGCLIDGEENDPATTDPELLEKLNANQVIAIQRLENVMDEFTREQEKVEVPAEGENDESSDESDEDLESDGSDSDLNILDDEEEEAMKEEVYEIKEEGSVKKEEKIDVSVEIEEKVNEAGFEEVKQEGETVDRKEKELMKNEEPTEVKEKKQEVKAHLEVSKKRNRVSDNLPDVVNGSRQLKRACLTTLIDEEDVIILD